MPGQTAQPPGPPPGSYQHQHQHQQPPSPVLYDSAVYSRVGDPPPDPGDEYHPLREEKFLKHAERYIRQDAADVDWDAMQAFVPWLAGRARFDFRGRPPVCDDAELGERIQGISRNWVGEEEMPPKEWKVLRIQTTGALISLRYPARVYPLRIHDGLGPEITLIRDDEPKSVSASYALTLGTYFEFLGTVAVTPGCDCLYVKVVDGWDESRVAEEWEV